MRFSVIAFLALAACENGPSCPRTISLYCDADQAGLTCDVTKENGQTAACRCDGQVFTCNDCPDLEAPIGACSAGQSCSVWGFENACACACDASGQWSCAVDDPDPNFHCSP